MSKLGQVLATIVLTPIVAFGSLIGAGHLLGTLNAPRPAAESQVKTSVEKNMIEPVADVAPEVTPTVMPQVDVEQQTDILSQQETATPSTYESAPAPNDSDTDVSGSEQQVLSENVLSRDDTITVIEDSALKDDQDINSYDKDTMLLYAYAVTLYKSFGSSFDGIYNVYIVDDSIYLVVTDENVDVFFERQDPSTLETWLMAKSGFVNIERSLYKSMIDVGVNAHFYLSIVYDEDINLPLLAVYDDGIVILDEIGNVLNSKSADNNTKQLSASQMGLPFDRVNPFTLYHDESKQETEDKYILNTDSMIIHHPYCDYVADIKPENYETTNLSLKELTDMGYRPCKQKQEGTFHD